MNKVTAIETALAVVAVVLLPWWATLVGLAIWVLLRRRRERGRRQFY